MGKGSRKIPTFVPMQAIYFIIVMGMFLVACTDRGKSFDKEFSPFLFQYGRLHVGVRSPDGTTGPGRLVRLYSNKQDWENKKVYQAAVTNDIGVAVFDSVHVGMIYYDCYVPSEPPLYGYDSVWVVADTVTYKTLYLK